MTPASVSDKTGRSALQEDDRLVDRVQLQPGRPVQALALAVEDHDRFKLGLVERLAARKP